MNKGILMIENMPESCTKCPLFTGYSCFVNGPQCSRLETRRADWCPLKEIPAKKYGYIEEVLNGN